MNGTEFTNRLNDLEKQVDERNGFGAAEAKTLIGLLRDSSAPVERELTADESRTALEEAAAKAGQQEPVQV